MTLPASGQIAMSQINTELNRSPASTQISIELAENGNYGTINIYSPSRPSGTNPASMSEWYSYNHAATTTVACYSLGTVNYYPNGSVFSGCCFYTSTATLYSNCSTLALDCFVYSNSNCSTAQPDYFFTTNFSTFWGLDGSGKVAFSGGCSC